jgi:hypothetical protein
MPAEVHQLALYRSLVGTGYTAVLAHLAAMQVTEVHLLTLAEGGRLS